jgi:hypothetical protein
MSLSERHVKSKIGECETCDNKDLEVKAYYANMYQCGECWAKDSAHQSPEAQQARVDALRVSQQVIKEAQAIDSGIQVRSDLFNAATTAILTICTAVDNDESITNKPYAKAEILKARFEHYKSVVFDLNEKLVEAGNNQKAIQVYLNNLANTLRAEEREKLQIADINYKPNPVKTPTVRTIKTVGSTQKKATKGDIKKAAQELGIAEFTLASFVLQSGGNLELAVNKIKASIAAAKNVG